MPSPAATAPQNAAGRSVCGVTSRTLSWSNHCSGSGHMRTVSWRTTPASGPGGTAPPTSRWPGPGHRPARGVQVKKDVIASDFGPQVMQRYGPDGIDGLPELVQLLTPEGERVDHPAF